MSVWSGTDDDYKIWAKLIEIEFKNNRGSQAPRKDSSGRVANTKSKRSNNSVQRLMHDMVDTFNKIKQSNNQPMRRFCGRIWAIGLDQVQTNKRLKANKTE